MHNRERRKDQQPVAAQMRTMLNQRQGDTLNALERLGWQLKFVRSPLFQASTVVVGDDERGLHAVLEDDGTINESMELRLRQ